MATLALVGAAALVAGQAHAATVYVYADPMTFETRRVVVDPDGPDRTYLCLMPPSQAGCTQIRRARR